MKLKAKFENDNGTVTVAVFDRDSGTVTAEDGRTANYRRAPGSNVVELQGPETLTLTFAGELKFEPGHSARYEGSDGRKGKATFLAMED